MVTINNVLQVLKDLFHNPVMDEDDVALGMSAIKTLQTHLPIDPREQIQSDCLKSEAIDMMLDAFLSGTCDKQGGASILIEAFKSLRLKDINQLYLFQFARTQENLVQKHLYMSYIKNGGMEEAQYGSRMHDVDSESFLIAGKEVYSLIDEIHYHHGIDVSSFCFGDILFPNNRLSRVAGDILLAAIENGAKHEEIFQECGLYGDIDQMSSVFFDISKKLFESGYFMVALKNADTYTEYDGIITIAAKTQNWRFLKSLPDTGVSIPVRVSLSNIDRILKAEMLNNMEICSYLFGLELNDNCGTKINDFVLHCIKSKPLVFKNTRISPDYIEQFGGWLGSVYEKEAKNSLHKENAKATLIASKAMIEPLGEDAINTFLSSTYNAGKAKIRPLLEEVFPNHKHMKKLNIEDDFSI